MAENNLASESQLFAGGRPKRRHKELTLPICGHRVRIQSLTERELSAYQAATMATSGRGANRARLADANARLIVLCLVDGAGNRILNHTHIAKLADWDAADTSYLSGQCSEHCGLDRDEIESLIKNSEGMVVDSSLTD